MADQFLVRVSPKYIKDYKNAGFLKALKVYKDRYICMRTVGYKCTPTMRCDGCRVVSGVVCHRYHARPSPFEVKHATNDAEELAMRLAFEVIFGMLSVEEIEKGTWLESKRRDAGHTMRMRILLRRCSGTGGCVGIDGYPWIVAPKTVM
jgi:hypothetical protein